MWRTNFCTRRSAGAGDFGKGNRMDNNELSTNLAEVGADCISREQAIDLLKQMRKDGDMIPWEGKDVFARIRKLPSVQPEIIRCRNCKFASGDSRICMKFSHSPIGELDFCAWAERRTDE